MIPRVEATIDLAALSHNFSIIKNLTHPDAKIMPMVKANAYGHGLIDVANHLAEADAFGVATLPEACKLRDAGIRQDIFVMCGFRSPDELLLFSEFNFTAIVHHREQIIWLSQVKLNQPICVWLKLDTGMHRLGVMPDEFESAVQALQSSKNVKQPIGIMTHLAHADADALFTQQQLKVFTEKTQHLNCPKSVVNSAGIIGFKESHYQLVRPGIMLYGISPFADKTGKELGLKPVMTFLSHVVAYKRVRQGDFVGYGCTWQAQNDLTVGIVTVGYGDGYPRQVKAGAVVWMDGQLCPIIGRVSMDLLAVDMSSIVHPHIGQTVVLWGDDLPAERVAQSAETIAYELFCQLTERVVKRVLK